MEIRGQRWTEYEWRSGRGIGRYIFESVGASEGTDFTNSGCGTVELASNTSRRRLRRHKSNIITWPKFTECQEQAVYHQIDTNSKQRTMGSTHDDEATDVLSEVVVKTRHDEPKNRL